MSLNDWNWHGFRGDKTWSVPEMVTSCDAPIRADQGNTARSDEYLDDEVTTKKKVQLLVHLLKKSKCTVIYSGAGLSKSSGIPDYATKSENTIVKEEKIESPLLARPTYSHFLLSELGRQNLVHHWIQQNHDGLPQKAYYPQSKINEIHGAWFDPSNPVVKFSGSLRSDLFAWMETVEQQTDLCLCLGTSLSGMNADRIAKTPAKKSIKRVDGPLGTVIINLQKTPVDSIAALRIWGKLDDVSKLIAAEMDLKVNLGKVFELKTEDHCFSVPYGSNGTCIKDQPNQKKMVLNLQDGSRIRIADPHSPYYNFTGFVHGIDSQNNYNLILHKPVVDKSGNETGSYMKFPSKLGWWWVYSAIHGEVQQLPIVNY